MKRKGEEGNTRDESSEKASGAKRRRRANARTQGSKQVRTHARTRARSVISEPRRKRHRSYDASAHPAVGQLENFFSGRTGVPGTPTPESSRAAAASLCPSSRFLRSPSSTHERFTSEAKDTRPPIASFGTKMTAGVRTTLLYIFNGIPRPHRPSIIRTGTLSRPFPFSSRATDRLVGLCGLISRKIRSSRSGPSPSPVLYCSARFVKRDTETESERMV